MKLLIKKRKRTIWLGAYGTGKWEITYLLFGIIPIYSKIVVI